MIPVKGLFFCLSSASLVSGYRVYRSSSSQAGSYRARPATPASPVCQPFGFRFAPVCHGSCLPPAFRHSHSRPLVPCVMGAASVVPSCPLSQATPPQVPPWLSMSAALLAARGVQALPHNPTNTVPSARPHHSQPLRSSVYSTSRAAVGSGS
jgi:hypothetical protein